MLTAENFRDLVSGRRRGLTASAARGLLLAAKLPYSLSIRMRNRLFDWRVKAAHRVGVPVVSVGNLTLGGTGKTPLVEWLARWFRQRGIRVAVVSRGYAPGSSRSVAEAGAKNDEFLELEQKLSDVPHVQNPDRVAAARLAIEEFESQLILLDDAFQHRRIHRDLDIVMIDALEPFGFGHVFPRGTLREPFSGVHRAQVVVLSRADMATPNERLRILDAVRRSNPAAILVEAAHAPRALRSAAGVETALDSLAGRTVAAFCGLGNPAGFRHTLAACGYRVSDFREFPDHHPYSRQDVEQLAQWVAPGAGKAPAAVLCTHKDLVKIGVERLGGVPLWAVAIEMDFLAGREALEAALERVVALCAVG